MPRRLVAALRRGLSRDPDARWPSLAPLIAELRRDPGRGRRNLMIGVLGAAAVAAAAAVMLLRSAPDPCGDGPAQLARTWNAGRAEDIAAAFSNAHLADSWPSVRAAIDRYGASWTSSYTAACRATRVDGAQSEALLDRRMLCLTRARSRLDSLLADVTAEREAAADAMRSIGALPELAQCADTAAFAQQRALPNDPALRERIERAAKLLDVAQAAVLDTWMKDRITPVETALAAARATGWPPLVAEATWVHGSVLTGDAAIKELLAGASAALAAGDDRIACWAYADAAWQLSDKPAEAERWLAQARGLWARLGQPADLGNRIENADAERLLAAGDVEGALAATRRANELSRRAYPDNRYDRVSEHYDLAHVLDAAGKYDEANAEITLAITDATQLSGASHPHVGQMLPLAAMIAQHAGKLDDALALSSRAVAIAESWYGKDDPRLVAPLAALGQMSVFAGKPDDARAALERALVLDPADGNSTYSLVMLEATTGHQDHGIELATAALARDERDTGVDNVDHLHWLVALGIMHREVGHLADSHRYLERGAKLGAAGLGADAPQTVNAEIELSYTLVAEKRAPEAVKLLEPALAFAQLAPPVAAELHTAFGQAAWETGQHDRARREVRAGRDAYEALGEAFAEQRTGADNWLAKHPS